MKRSVLLTLFFLAFSPVGASGQSSRYDNVVLRPGMGISGANVAVCQPLATTAASVTSNLATLTMSSNPQTAGFVSGMTILVAGFTGGDTYFNGGSIVGNVITGGYTILSVTSTTIVYALVHANASAASIGTVLQIGNTTTSCAGLSSIYTDSTLGTLATNPFVGDGLGNYGFWANPGQYYVQVYNASTPAKLYPVSLACAPANTSSCGALLSAANVWTASQTINAPGAKDLSLGNLNNILYVDGVKYTTVQAAINALPAGGGVVVLNCGTSYVGPTTWVNGMTLTTNCDSATNPVVDTTPVFSTTLTYSSSLALGSSATLSGVNIDGVTLAFTGTNTLTFVAVQNSRFNITVTCVTGSPCVSQGPSVVSGAASFWNRFPLLQIITGGTKVLQMQSVAGTFWTENTYDKVILVATGTSVTSTLEFNLNTDSNHLHNVQLYYTNTGAITANGVVFNNSGSPTVDNDADWETIDRLDVTSLASSITGTAIQVNKSTGNSIGVYVGLAGFTTPIAYTGISNFALYDNGGILGFNTAIATGNFTLYPTSGAMGNTTRIVSGNPSGGIILTAPTQTGTLGLSPAGTTVSGSDISFPGNVRINGPDPHWDITAFGASGSTQSTTATCTAAATTCTLAAAIDFANSTATFTAGIHIAGAGASGLPYFGKITAGAGTTTITVSPAIGTSVAGATASHDDIPAINAAIDACTANAVAAGSDPGSGGVVFFPPGTQQQKSGPVHHHNQHCQLSGPPGTKLSADLAVWNGTGSYGPTLVSTGSTTAASYMSIASFPAALLTGSGTAFGMNSANGVFNARDCKVCAELNGLQQFTVEGTFNFSSLTGQKMGLISSSGKRDSVQGQQTGVSLQTSQDTLNKAECQTNIGGTTKTVTDTVALTTGSNIHLACTYDHANLRLFKNGTSVGTPQAVVGAVVQAPLEEVLIGGILGDFPENFSNNVFNNPTTGVTVDGVRISNTARYTSNFTAPTAKWTLAQVDANTLIQCDFDSQPDVFTVCYTSNGGSTPFPVYLPYHRSVCSGGNENFHLSNLQFGDPSGRDYDGIYFSGGAGWILENLFFGTAHNGILVDGCDFDYHMRDVEISSFNGSGGPRYVTALNSGIGLLDNIHVGGGAVPLVLPGNGVYNHIFLSPSGASGPDLMSMLIKSAGAGTIGGVKPVSIINDVEADIEAAIPNYQTVLMLDQVGSAIVTGSDLECRTANTTCVGATVNGGGAVQFNETGLVSGSAATGLIHVPAPLPTSPIMLNGIQNPQNTSPLTDGGTTIVCGGTASGSASGCSMPTYSTSTNCAQNTASPAACGSSAAGAFVVPTTTTTYTVNTTAVLGTTSRIFLTPLTFAANLPSSPTCVAPAAGAVTISAVVANTSFTFALPSTTGQTCWQYHIMN